MKKKYQNKFPKLNFIGNKVRISSWICDNFPKNISSIYDAFSGSCSISYELKKRGFQVFLNDNLYINYLIGKALVENNSSKLESDDLDRIFFGKPFEGFFYENFSNVFYFPNECKELDLYRKNILNLESEHKKALAFVLLRRSMIRKMPYSRFNIKWEKIIQLRDEEYSYEKYKRRRGYHNLSFKDHFLDNVNEYNDSIFDNKQMHKAFNLDIFEGIKNVKSDLIYLDPPYKGTLNNYLSFYGPIDEYIKSKKYTKSPNNFLDNDLPEKIFEKLFSNLENFKYLALSYNSNSSPNKEQLFNILNKFCKDLEFHEKDFSYKITGKEMKNENKEYLFIGKLN